MKKIKYLQNALAICLNSKTLFEYAGNSFNSSTELTNTTSSAAVTQNNNSDGEFVKHILLFESRLQFALKTLIKLWLSGVKDTKHQAELYKKMYMETLNIRKVTGAQHDENSVNTLALTFANLLARLSELERMHANNIANNTINKNASC